MHTNHLISLQLQFSFCYCIGSMLQEYANKNRRIKKNRIWKSIPKYKGTLWEEKKWKRRIKKMYKKKEQTKKTVFFSSYM